MDAHVIAAALIGADEATKHRFLGKGWQSKSLPDLMELVAKRAVQIAVNVDAENARLDMRAKEAAARKKPGPKPKTEPKGGDDAES